jgi:hypothetical protein
MLLEPGERAAVRDVSDNCREGVASLFCLAPAQGHIE